MADPGDDLNPPDETFQKKFFRRMGDLGMPFVLHEITTDTDRMQEAKSAGRWFEPRSDLPIEDQRGMSLPQLNLQAQYLKSQGAYNRLPPFDPNEPITPLGRQLGAADIPTRQGGEIPYLLKTGHDYATKLTPEEDKDYQRWAKKAGRNPKDEEQDYDLRGYYKDVVKGNPDLPERMKDRILYERDLLAKTGGKGHLPDTYKKPNHPTFSDESIYHDFPGDEKREIGGHWDTANKVFTPGPANQLRWNRSALQHYFDKYEPGYKVAFPDWYQ